MFRELPRFVGFPKQIFVKSEFAFNMFFKEFNGVTPFFVTTYQFKDEATPIVDSMVFDIDSNFGLRFPYKNTKMLKKFCCKYDIPYLLNFSGGKGFHLFMKIKPIIPKIEEKDELRTKIYSTQVAISKLVNLQCVDYPTYGRLHFLIRYPTSVYIRSRQPNGFYCRNLTPEDFDKGLKHISKLVETPGEFPKDPKPSHTLDDIIDMLPNYKEIERGFQEDMIELVRSGIEPPTLDAILLPCLKELAQHAHPRHFERVELGSWLKVLSYTDLAIVTFMKNCKWTRFDYNLTTYQVSTLKPRHPDCKKLRQVYGDNCKNCILYRRKVNEIK